MCKYYLFGDIYLRVMALAKGGKTCCRHSAYRGGVYKYCINKCNLHSTELLSAEYKGKELLKKNK